MTITQALVVVALLGAVAIVAGVALLVGGAWGLITGGVLAIAGAVVLYDPKADAKR